MTPTRRREALRYRPRLDGLEGRALLSGMVPTVTPHRVAAIRAAANTSDGSGAAAILSALRGGPGNEFVRIVRPQVPNLGAVLLKFQLGLIQEYAVRGAVFRTPKLLESFTGPKFDQLSAIAAGAVIRSKRRLELGALMRGPIDAATPSVYVFGIDRGGATTAPIPGLPNHRFNATVTIVRDPNGTLTGSVQDLNTGATTPIARSNIFVQGPALRVYVDPRALPSTGAALARYRFAFVARDSTSGGAETVASVAPTGGTILVGDLRGR